MTTQARTTIFVAFICRTAICPPDAKRPERVEHYVHGGIAGAYTDVEQAKQYVAGDWPEEDAVWDSKVKPGHHYLRRGDIFFGYVIETVLVGSDK